MGLLNKIFENGKRKIEQIDLKHVNHLLTHSKQFLALHAIKLLMTQIKLSVKLTGERDFLR